MRIVIAIVCWLFCINVVHSQNFGGNPSSLKWNQINTDSFKVVYPKGLDSSAMRVADIITHQSRYNLSTIGDKLKKITIIMQPQTTISNGFVMLGPWRSEFYTTTPQDALELGGLSWTDILSIHEFRHVQQYSNLRNGLSKTAGILFGDYGQLLANAASVPDWFFEGEAVYNETLLSSQGRGRLPFFFNGYKSLYYQQKDYSYMKLRNGSLKDYVPNHYQLGYLLVAYGREKYGDDFWRKVTHDASSFKPLFYPLQGAVKKYAGVSYTQFVADALNFYHQQWKDNNNNTRYITPLKKNVVVNEKYPYINNQQQVISLYSDSRHVAYFKEDDKKLAVRDIDYDDYFSYNNNKIIYSSYKRDARWANREYSEIRLLNSETGKRKKLTSKTRYFSPDISNDGKTIVASELDDTQHSWLVLLDTNGKLLNRQPAPAGHVYSYPKFSADDKYIYILERDAQGLMALVQQSLNDSSKKILLPFAKRIIGYPLVQHDTLLYTCSNNGNDEVWAYVINEQKNYKLAETSTGLYQGAIKNDSVYSSNFTADGYRLTALHAIWQQQNNTADILKDLYVQHPFQSSLNNYLQNIPSQNFTITKYYKANHPFNFHSRSPYIDGAEYSVKLFGNNVFNTFQHELYYAYNINEGYHRAGYTGIYGGWYVQPFIDVNQTWNRNFLIADSAFNAQRFYYNQTQFAGGLQLPLNFTGGLMYRNLLLSASFRNNQIAWKGLAKTFFENRSFNYGEFRVSYSQSIQQAAQQIYPHIAQSFLLQYRQGSKAYQLLASGSFYFPGFAPTHSLVISTAYQLRDTTSTYIYDNNFSFSRGYSKVDFPRMWKVGGTYHFPLAYPDWGFGNIVYFLRIRGDVFFDYTEVKSLRTQLHYQFNTAGAELFFDTKWWNQQPLSFGIRYDNLLNNHNKSRIEFVLPILF